VRYQNVYAGADLLVERRNELSLTFEVSDLSAVSAVKVRVEGVQAVGQKEGAFELINEEVEMMLPAFSVQDRQGNQLLH
jgi:hypothetical protein